MLSNRRTELLVVTRRFSEKGVIDGRQLKGGILPTLMLLGLLGRENKNIFCVICLKTFRFGGRSLTVVINAIFHAVERPTDLVLLYRPIYHINANMFGG